MFFKDLDLMYVPLYLFMKQQSGPRYNTRHGARFAHIETVIRMQDRIKIAINIHNKH